MSYHQHGISQMIDARTRRSSMDDQLPADELKEMGQPGTTAAVMASTVCLTEDDTECPANKNHREKLNELLHGDKIQYAIVVLVIIDIIIVIAELVLDLRAGSEHHDNSASHVLHYISIAILSVFMIELLLKIYAMGFTFFKHKMEVFDGFVIIVSFALDIAFSNEQGGVDSVSLIVVLRLWRVTRIVNGIILSVQMRAERKVQAVMKENAELKKELEQLKSKCAQLESELTTLKQS